MAVPADVELDVVVGRAHPIDVGQRHEAHLVAGLHRDPLRRLGRGRGWLQLGDHRGESRRKLVRTGGPEAVDGALEGLLETLAIEGFQQVVHRVDLERLQREPVVSGDEDHRWRHVHAEPIEHAEAGQARHLHIEEHQIGTMRPDRADR